MANQHHPDKRPVTYWLPRELVSQLRDEAQRRTETEGRKVTQVDLVTAGIDHVLGNTPPGQITVTDYDLYAPNGDWFRTATKVVLADGREICFTKKLNEREALQRARVSL